MDNCPKCGTDFNKDDIYDFFFLKYTNENGSKYPTTVEKIREGAERYPKQYEPLPPNLDTMTQNELDAWNSARMYGWRHDNPVFFRREIGIEIQGVYDGVALWKCPDCKHVWKRFDWIPDSVLENFLRNQE